ncbi:glycosyl hydrolase family 65 central catalytic domain-containing protein [Limtongia smithiae]|uniref:glycosyl hydrolase family 65 central catalytic domain-containing protein n=1 Tax=Limtongia smithiae TaxID=1125753 RepID=UPI0034CD5573
MKLLLTSCVAAALLLADTAVADISRLLREQLIAEAEVLNDPLLSGAEYEDHEWKLRSTIFTTNRFQIQPYVSNGYIGARLPVESVGFSVDLSDSEDGGSVNGSEPTNGWPLFSPRFTGAYIAGFWNLQADTPATNFPELLERGGESVISTVPIWANLFVGVDGTYYGVGVNASHVQNYSQSLSLKHGIVETKLKWLPDGSEAKAVNLSYEILAHRKIPTLAMIKLDIVCSENTTIKIADVLDGQGSYRTEFFESGYSTRDNTGMWTSVSPTGLPNTVAYEYSHLGFSDDKAVNFDYKSNYSYASDDAATISQEFEVTLEAGKEFTVYKFVGVASTDAYANPKRVAEYTARVASTIGWRLAELDHKVVWEDIWNTADIVFPGNAELQKSTRASIFHLLSALRPGSEPHGRGDNSVAVSGLSADSYAGLVFWDADTWMHPALSVLYPEHAKSINNYRQRIHEQSIENAQSYNLSGAIYSWTSGRFGNCTGTGPCVDYEYHINADIAQAHWNQYLLSDDQDWLREKAWPIIKDAANMFASYVVKNATTEPYYYTYNMTDPDEYANHINNGALTNGAISKVMSWAQRAAEILGEDVDPSWADIEQNMFIPVAKTADIILEYPTMNGSAEVKQADVVLLNYPLEQQYSYQRSLNNLDFYAMAQSADGPAMTWAIFAINAAELSPTGCASYTYMLYSSQPYLREPYYQFSEQMNDDIIANGGTRPAFPFLTGHGGYLQVLTHGFTGFRPREDAFFLDPYLPPQISDGYTIKGMKWHGNLFDVTINLNETVVYLRPKDWKPSYKDSAIVDFVVQSRQSQRRQYSDSETVTGDGARVRIGGGVQQGDYWLLPGESLVVPTRRSDLNGTLIAGNVAQCQPAMSNTTWVKGHFPISAVDGSNSTSWQPDTRDPSALLIDLGSTKNISGFDFNWGKTPPKEVSIGYASYESELDKFGMQGVRNGDLRPTDLDFFWPVVSENVTISAAYDAARVLEVLLHTGNTTHITLDSPVTSRWVIVVVKGSYDEERRYGDIGATVAEVSVIEAKV